MTAISPVSPPSTDSKVGKTYFKPVVAFLQYDHGANPSYLTHAIQSSLPEGSFINAPMASVKGDTLKKDLWSEVELVAFVCRPIAGTIDVGRWIQDATRMTMRLVPPESRFSSLVVLPDGETTQERAIAARMKNCVLLPYPQILFLRDAIETTLTRKL